MPLDKPKGVVSVSDIKSRLLSPATTSHYLLDLPIPSDANLASALRAFLGPDQETIQLQCCEASLPGSQFATMNIDNDHTGVSERHPYRKIFNDRIDLTFYVDATNYLPIQYFERWMQYIAGEDLNSSGQNDPNGKNFHYRFRYPDEYMCEGFQITKIEKDFYEEVRTSNLLEDIVNVVAGTNFGDTDYKRRGSLLRYNFVRSFPLAINSMPISYETSQLLKVTVSMAYIRYTIENLMDIMPARAGRSLSFDFGNNPFAQALGNSFNPPPTPKQAVPPGRSGSARGRGSSALVDLNLLDATGRIGPGG